MHCIDCNGKGYNHCECWPGDCICGWGDEDCEECRGEGWTETHHDVDEHDPTFGDGGGQDEAFASNSDDPGSDSRGIRPGGVADARKDEPMRRQPGRISVLHIALTHAPGGITARPAVHSGLCRSPVLTSD
ncbi:hypothetical protein psul1_p52 [Paracoccus phage vB_PsuS_Psul1]|nr:hypothetical protein psul1_p52 [Paracoccus phage vB_PsuS_Psul1]